MSPPGSSPQETRPSKARPPARSARIEIRVVCRTVRFDRRRLCAVLERLLADHGRTGLVSLAIVDDREIHRLNREFLGRDHPTDVIAFPLGEDGGEGETDVPLGEVVVSAETTARQARDRGHDPADELALCAIHGALHLVGYDDGTTAERRIMRAGERRYLATFRRT